MKRDYLGDSYDAVKRFWQQVLSDWAPLYADPRFIPEDLRAEFTRLTGISMLPDSPQQPYSILNDPDTGIRLPAENNQKESRAHIGLPRIRNQLRQPGLRSVITFDQSDYRHSELKRDQQRDTLRCVFLRRPGYSHSTLCRMRRFSSPFPTPTAACSSSSDCRASASLMTALRHTNETATLRCRPGHSLRKIDRQPSVPNSNTSRKKNEARIY
jgi:hypothetical protein